MPARRAVALLLLAAGAVGAWHALDMRVDNRLERWLGENGADNELYREFRRDFGSDEFLFAEIGGGDFFSARDLDELLSVAEDLEGIPGVVEVRGIPTIYRDLFGAEDPEALADELTSTPFYRGLFISQDSGRAGLLLEVEPPPDAGARRKLVQATWEALRPLERAGREVRLVGSPALIAALDEVSQREARRTIPIALIGSLLVLVVMLRSMRAMIVTAASAALTVVLTLGVAVASGMTLNMVSTALPPLLWVLAVSNSTHIIRRYQDLRATSELDTALATALDETTRPCTMAAVTTAAGFASLVVAEMGPVRELGFLAALGILLSLAVNLSVTPVLVELLRVPSVVRRGKSSGTAWLRGWLAHPRRVLTAAGVFMVVAAAVIPRIRVESNPLTFLPSEHPTTRDFRSIDSSLGGFYTLEVLLEPPDDWYAPKVWPVIDRVGARLQASRIVTRVVSPIDVLAKLNHWQQAFDPEAYHPPASLQLATEVLDSAGGRGRRALAHLISDDGRVVRLSVLVNELHEQQFLELVGEARRLMEGLPEGWRGEVTGQVMLLVEAQQRLVTTQIQSLALAFILVFAIIGAGLRSLHLLVVAVPPNLLPILAAFAAMAVLDLPLDAGTVMVASIALGIAVDNTVHVLANVHRRRMQAGSSVAAAISSTLRDIGPAMMVTAATASVGFVALATSDFVPIRDFGLLATVAMVAAFAADALVLPALLIVTGERS